jgi:bacterioferritin (cytochrome b1)
VSDPQETLDEKQAIERLNAALTLQLRSALQYSLTAASLSGLQVQGLAEMLTGYGDAELADARLLIEKIVSLGGEPTTDVAGLHFERDAQDAFRLLVDFESETAEALQASIEPTGREARSEALEHMLEHMIMRKQRQIDFLERALR